MGTIFSAKRQGGSHPNLHNIVAATVRTPEKGHASLECYTNCARAGVSQGQEHEGKTGEPVAAAFMPLPQTPAAGAIASHIQQQMKCRHGCRPDGTSTLWRTVSSSFAQSYGAFMHDGAAAAGPAAQGWAGCAPVLASWSRTIQQCLFGTAVQPCRTVRGVTSEEAPAAEHGAHTRRTGPSLADGAGVEGIITVHLTLGALLTVERRVTVAVPGLALWHSGSREGAGTRSFADRQKSV
jgi:hypothetical protein